MYGDVMWIYVNGMQLREGCPGWRACPLLSGIIYVTEDLIKKLDLNRMAFQDTYLDIYIYIYSDILPSILSDIHFDSLSAIQSGILSSIYSAFYLSSILAFYLAFYLTSILFYVDIDILSAIHSGIIFYLDLSI